MLCNVARKLADYTHTHKTMYGGSTLSKNVFSHNFANILFAGLLYLSVQELANVWEGCCFPGMHCSVYEVKMRDPVVGEEEGHHQVEVGGRGQAGGQGQLACGPEVAQHYLYTSCCTTSRGGH